MPERRKLATIETGKIKSYVLVHYEFTLYEDSLIINEFILNALNWMHKARDFFLMFSKTVFNKNICLKAECFFIRWMLALSL